MGVPAFYRWLSVRYPKIVVDCVEEQAEMVGSIEIPVDINQPNPNGVEFDNLYLDMNGIIHPCFHPEDRPAPSTESEVFKNIFDYIDRLVAISRPRKLIYMAIDGVAPRAKMNQQRSRRFRAAQERVEAKEEARKIREEYAKQGIRVKEVDEGENFDSNTITPGTPFMDRLAQALQWYVHKQLNEHPGWRNLQVVLSDSNTPGEGEHKFMQFVREQRDRPGWNPNTWHCVYGLDADLIMLALASHEPHFYLLREVVFQPSWQDKKKAEEEKLLAATNRDESAVDKPQADGIAQKPYQFLKINVLRDYLALEYSDLQLPFAYDPERVIDDFVFLCFFVGNDFLPHMPTLDIREKGIELMLHVYRRELPKLNGYLSNGSHLYLDRIEQFIGAIGAFEDEIFQSRMRKLKSDKRRHEDRKNGGGQGGGRGGYGGRGGGGRGDSGGRGSGHTGPTEARPNYNNPRSVIAQTGPIPVGRANFPETAPKESIRPAPTLLAPGEDTNKRAAEALKQRLKRKLAGVKEEADAAAAAPDSADAAGAEAAEEHAGAGVRVAGGTEDTAAIKRIKLDNDAQAQALWAELEGEGVHLKAADEPEAKTEEQTAEDEKTATDEMKAKLKESMKAKSDMFEDMCKHEEDLRLGESGWKERYYQEKFGVAAGPDQDAMRKEVVEAYVEGLCWVMKYYYDGVASWRWFYPFHYAPFASDLVGISSLDIKFTLGEPFQPFNQLMGVLPAASRHALPEPLQPLFIQDNSPILDFYPEDFSIDMNGKRFAWQGVALLPFIDEARLLGATQPVFDKLCPDDQRRNERRLSLLIARADSPAGKAALDQAQAAKAANTPLAQLLEVETALRAAECGGTSGQIIPCAGNACPPVIPVPLKNLGDDVQNNQVVMCMYKDPPHQRHEARIMDGTVVEATPLGPSDVPQEEPLWCQQHAMRRANGGGRGGFGGRGDFHGGRGVGAPGRRMIMHGMSNGQQFQGQGGAGGGGPSPYSAGGGNGGRGGWAGHSSGGGRGGPAGPPPGGVMAHSGPGHGPPGGRGGYQGAPAPYGAPQPGRYQARPSPYGAPAPYGGAPGMGMPPGGAYIGGIGVPPQMQQMGQPGGGSFFAAMRPQYGAPGGPQPGYAPPQQQYGAPGQQQYGAPAPQQYGAPRPQYGAPRPGRQRR